MSTSDRVIDSLDHAIHRFRSEIGSGRLSVTLVAGLILGLMQTAQSASFAALIFNGDLAPQLARGIGMALFASAVGMAVITILTSLPAMAGGAQNVPAAILGVATAAIATAIVNDGRETSTVLAAVLLTTLATGVFLWVLGTFKLAGLVRFLPYPVVGGFLAGTGWLMLLGGVGSMIGTSLSLPTLAILLDPALLAFWLPGVIAGVVILFLARRSRHPLLLPAIITAIIIVFYAVARLRGLSIDELSAQGWLLGPFPEGGIWQPLRLSELAGVDWPLIAGQLPNLLIAVVMSAIALLLNASALEIALNRDVDMNREMRAAGWTNLIAGFGSGMPAYQQLGMTSLNARLGTTGRLPGLIAAGVCGLALFTGGDILQFVPKMVFGAILVYLGLSFLYQWVFEAWSRLPLIDHAIVLLILLVIAAVGFLQGVIVGVLATVIMFVFNYSTVEVVKHALTGANYRSRVTRPPQQQAILDEAGIQLIVLHLQGFLFFGTANNLLERVRRRLRQPGEEAVRFLLLDFKRVTGLDTTALLSFSKMKQLAQADDLALVFCGLAPELHKQMAAGGILEDGRTIKMFADLDSALEWCEDRILEAAGCRPDEPLPPLPEQLIDLIGDAATVEQLLPFLEREELPLGTVLIRQGDPPEALYFLESGQLTAQLRQDNGAVLRLETMLGGRVVGELGFYLGTSRSAEVVVDSVSVVYKLTQAALTGMEAEAPDAASEFHRLIIRLLSERVTHLINTVEGLQR